MKATKLIFTANSSSSMDISQDHHVLAIEKMPMTMLMANRIAPSTR